MLIRNSYAYNGPFTLFGTGHTNRLQTWKSGENIAKIRLLNPRASVPAGEYTGTAFILAEKTGNNKSRTPQSSTHSASLWGTGSIIGSGAGSSDHYAYARLLSSIFALGIAGSGAIATGILEGETSLVLNVNVSALPTADDNAYATMSQIIENGITMKEAMRLILAVLVGKTDIIDLGGGSATVKFRDTADSKDRVSASMTGSERSSITTNKT
jgi:hypothetical protein